MRELRDILNGYRELAARGERGVLASVVRVEGSTYRRAGARMLVRPDDSYVGLLSGGCLEGDLLEHARAVRGDGRARAVHYDHRGEDDLVWGLGLGCAGELDIWLEPVDAARPGPLAALERWLRAGIGGALAVAVSGPAQGRRRALGADGVASGELAAADPALAEALARGRGERRATPAGELWIELAQPPLPLAIFGGGADVQPLVRVAASLGWDVTVADGREGFASADRFPGARVVLAPPERAVAEVGIGAGHYAVLMTHHFLHDQVLLGDLLASPARYVGVLGPRQRTLDLLAALAAEGRDVEPGERLHGPAGLDLGAEGPEEIALSIAAEILAVAAGRDGGWLRERRGPIHEP